MKQPTPNEPVRKNSAATQTMAERNTLKLPKDVERDSRFALLESYLERSATYLNPQDTVATYTVDCNERMAVALRAASATGSIVRGLEGAQQTLMSEARGMARADARTGARRGARVSRVLVLADDGSKRFYRDVAPLMKYHADRLLVIRVRLTGDELGATALGGGATARALLLTQKDAVANLLLALTGDREGDTSK